MPDTTQFHQERFGAAQAAGHGIQEDLGRIGSDLVDALGARAEEIVTEQKARAAGEIAALGSMLRDTARRVEQSERGAVTDYASRAADQIDRFADRLRTSSWRVLAADAEDFARRSPALFLTCSALAGFLLGRLVGTPSQEPPTTTWSGPIGEPISRPEDGAIGGTLTAGGVSTGYGLPTGEETR